MPLHPRRCSALYSFSCLLDAVDGMLARRFNQSSRFGTVLDMVTDRCTTTCLLVFLSTAKPAYIMVFQCLICLDLASHYVQMYASQAMGGSGQTHKDVSVRRGWLLHLYYTNKVSSHESLGKLDDRANLCIRPSCLPAVHSTSCSSSRSTYYASVTRASHQNMP